MKAIIITLIFLLSACGQGLQEGKFRSQFDPDIRSDDEFNITKSVKSFIIVNENQQRIYNATIMIGSAPGNPFEGNIFHSDDKGEVLIPEEWKAPLPVTIEAPEYIRTTFLNQLPDREIFQLNSIDQDNQYQVGGTTKGYGSLKKDGLMDVGLILPATSMATLLNFNMSTFVSSQVDVIEIMGKRIALPSNLAIPKQTENYFLPITIDKPKYRFFFSKEGHETLLALHVQFPLQDVIDQIQNGKNFFDLANKFNFLGGTLKDIEIKNENMTLDLSVDEFKFEPFINYQSPEIAPGHVLLTLAFSQRGRVFFPTDLKNPKSNQKIKLKSINNKNSESYVLTVLKKDAQDDQMNILQMSTVLTRANENVDFLGLVNSPKFNKNILFVEPPSPVKGLHQMGTYAVLSDIKITENEGGIKVEKKVRQWEFFAPNWIDQVQIPEWPTVEFQNNLLRWEVLYLGDRGLSGEITSGPQMLEKASHVSRNGLDL